MFYALEFSEANNIVDSDDWANMIPENGIDGGGALGSKWKLTVEQRKAKSGENSPIHGKKKSDDHKRKISVAKTGKKQSEEQIRNNAEARKKKIPIRCIETGEVFDGPAYAVDWLKSQGVLTVQSSPISNCCKGIYKSAYGYTWSYLM